MNQGRIWCVVQPTIGLPLFLGSVALMSFTVHFAVLNNTTWMKDFFNGTPMKQASVETAAPKAVDAVAAVKPALAFDVAQSTATIDAPQTLAVKVKPLTGTPLPDVPGPG